jgi:hypothetical protein
MFTFREAACFAMSKRPPETAAVLFVELPSANEKAAAEKSAAAFYCTAS